MGSSKDIKTDFKGLVTAPGLFMRAEASCTEAHNLLFDAPGVVRKRRGFEKLAGNAGGPVWKAFSSRAMGDSVLCHTGTSNGTGLRYGDGSGALSAVSMIGSSSLTRADNNTRMALALCEKNHYVTAAEGVARIQTTFASATQRFAGMPRGLAPQCYEPAGLTPIVAGSNFGDGYARAYRVTWHLKDAEGVEMGGAPTGRAVFRNQSGVTGWVVATTCSFAMRIPLPRELGVIGTALTTSHFYRLWGNVTWNAAGGEQGDDEMYLINEAYLTNTDISNGYASYTDATPDSFLKRQRRLHTNTQNYPSSETGAAQGTVNEDAPPPIADDVAYWQDVAWFANIKYRPRLQVRLLAVGGSGLIANDTVAVTGPTGVTVTLTAKAPSVASTEFTVFTGMATTQMNIEATSMSFVEAFNINAAATLGVRAYYVSVGNMTPGYIYFESLLAEGTPPGITFTPSRVAAFSLMNGASATSSIDSQPNGTAFSKPGRADAVPPVNLFSVGPADSRILRIHPYRDRLLYFTDAGIYQVVGKSFADFRAIPFDLTYRLMVRESVVTCDDRVYAWCFEGIVEISNSGVEVISTPIEPSVIEYLRLIGDTVAGTGVTGGQTGMGLLGFAVAYRHEHRVQFFMPEAYDTANLNGCSDWLSFDTRTRAWSTGGLSKKIGGAYRDNRSCGVVRLSDDLLMLGNWSSGADTFLFKERRTLTSADFSDTFQDGTSAAITSTLIFQYQVPEMDGAAHWQQATVHFEGGEVTWRPVPTACTMTWLLQPDGISDSEALSGNTQQFWRVEPVATVRRGNRLRVRLVHSTAEFLGIIGFTQSVRIGTRFLGRAS